MEEAMVWDSSGSTALDVEAASKEVPRSASLADPQRRRPIVHLLTVMAVRRPLQALVTALGWNQLYFSLPTDELKGRVFRGFVVALNAALPPSGVVPGGSDGRRGELAFLVGGEGQDDVPQNTLVLLAKNQEIL
jgi:hypothetical protein